MAGNPFVADYSDIQRGIGLGLEAYQAGQRAHLQRLAEDRRMAHEERLAVQAEEQNRIRWAAEERARARDFALAEAAEARAALAEKRQKEEHDLKLQATDKEYYKLFRDDLAMGRGHESAGAAYNAVRKRLGMPKVKVTPMDMVLPGGVPRRIGYEVDLGDGSDPVHIDPEKELKEKVAANVRLSDARRAAADADEARAAEAILGTVGQLRGGKSTGGGVAAPPSIIPSPVELAALRSKAETDVGMTKALSEEFVQGLVTSDLSRGQRAAGLEARLQMQAALADAKAAKRGGGDSTKRDPKILDSLRAEDKFLSDNAETVTVQGKDKRGRPELRTTTRIKPGANPEEVAASAARRAAYLEGLSKRGRAAYEAAGGKGGAPAAPEKPARQLMRRKSDGAVGYIDASGAFTPR